MKDAAIGYIAALLCLMAAVCFLFAGSQGAISKDLSYFFGGCFFLFGLFGALATIDEDNDDHR